MQPLQYVSQHHVANLHLSTHMARPDDNNHTAITPVYCCVMSSLTQQSHTALHWGYWVWHHSLTPPFIECIAMWCLVSHHSLTPPFIECIVMWCQVSHHPSLSVLLQVKVIRNSEDCFPTSFDYIYIYTYIVNLSISDGLPKSPVTPLRMPSHYGSNNCDSSSSMSSKQRAWLKKSMALVSYVYTYMII